MTKTEPQTLTPAEPPQPAADAGAPAGYGNSPPKTAKKQPPPTASGKRPTTSADPPPAAETQRPPTSAKNRPITATENRPIASPNPQIAALRDKDREATQSPVAMTPTPTNIEIIFVNELPKVVF